MNNCFVETSRLLLRRLEEADFPAYAAYAVDDEMSRMMGRAFLHAETDIRQNFDWLKDKEHRCYGIVEKANEQLIGNLNIGALPDVAGTAGLSISGQPLRSHSAGRSTDYRTHFMEPKEDSHV